MGATTLSDADVRAAVLLNITSKITLTTNFAIPGRKLDTQKIHEWIAIEIPSMRRPSQRSTGHEKRWLTVCLRVFVKPSYVDGDGKPNVYRSSQLQGHIIDELEHSSYEIGSPAVGLIQFREGQAQFTTRAVNNKSLPAGTRTAEVKFTVEAQSF